MHTILTLLNLQSNLIIIMWDHFLWLKSINSILLSWSLIFQKLCKFTLFFMSICFNSLSMILYLINMLSLKNLLSSLTVNMLDISTAFLISNMIIIVNLIFWNILWTEKIINSHKNFLIILLRIFRKSWTNIMLHIQINLNLIFCHVLFLSVIARTLSHICESV